MATVKRWIITGFSFGAGLAIVAGLIVGGYFWYLNKPKPWNTEAVTAIFYEASAYRDPGTIRFSFTLQNNTDVDYRIDVYDVTLKSLLGQKRLSTLNVNEAYVGNFPLFIPSKQSHDFDIEFDFGRLSNSHRDRIVALIEKHEKEEEELLELILKLAPNLDGFVIFDERNRYQINLELPRR